jgi:hypothetical protein
MSRRRRSSEPAFGSDSFLDVVANLVGIVLIIIVLVGARIRHLPQLLVPVPAQPEPRAAVEPKPVVIDTSKEEAEIWQARAAIADLQLRLLESVKRLEQRGRQRVELEAAVRAESATRGQVQRVLEEQRSSNAALHAQVKDTEASQKPLRERLAELNQAIKQLEQRPPERRALRYHLPVSKPLGAGELLFECRGGRVSFIDLQALLDEVRSKLPSAVEELSSKWEVSAETGPIGAYKLRYTVVRERSGPLDTAFTSLPPAERRGFSYGLDGWEVVPIWAVRGETLDEAIAEGSRFRAVVEASDPQTAALTFFVYPDSFNLYRELRDLLFERGFVVAGRPLLMDAPISGSRKGSISRGQ